MKLDSYSLKGRIAPAFFSIILPIMIFNHFFVSEEFSKFVGEIIGAKLISNLTISGISLYLLAEIGRLIGKNVFERCYFKDESFMPTTNLLMFCDDTYSAQHKEKIRVKIATDFNIKLATAVEEAEDEADARRRIVETMALVRKQLKENKFLFQHNVEYGAMRNVIGGSVLGLLFSAFNIVFFSLFIHVKIAVTISVATLIVYLLFILFSKVIINFYGKNYAKILYREYLTA